MDRVDAEFSTGLDGELRLLLHVVSVEHEHAGGDGGGSRVAEVDIEMPIGWVDRLLEARTAAMEEALAMGAKKAERDAKRAKKA